MGAHLTNSLNIYKAKHLLRRRVTIQHKSKNLTVINRETYLNFTSNDYLCLAEHPKVKQAFINGVRQYGLGSGGSALLSGYQRPHEILEMDMANFLQREKAILFNSGYHANLGLLQSLANKNTTIIADKYCHASLLDGAQLSRAKLRRYPHQHLQHAAALLSQHKNTLLVTESIFSMQGDITALDHLATLAKQHAASLIVDDAHGFGVLGQTGGGSCEHFQLTSKEIPFLITPLGKACGSYGAVVSGDGDKLEPILQFARTYRYSTALPPAICEATCAALRLIQQDKWRQQRLNELIVFFNQTANKHGIKLYSMDITPIRSVTIGCSVKSLALQNILMSKGFFTACIRPPTVPMHGACLRISLNCTHTEGEISHLLEHIAENI